MKGSTKERIMFLAAILLIVPILAACATPPPTPTSVPPTAAPAATTARTQPPATVAATSAPATVAATATTAPTKPPATATAVPPTVPPKLSMTDVTLVSSTVNPPSISNIYYLTAIQKGYFAKYGLKVTPQQSGGSPLSLAAIQSGSAQFASVNINTLSSAVAEGAKLKTVVVGAFYVAGAIVVTDKIKTLKDLATSTMGASAVGSAEQTKALAYLKSQNIDTSKIAWAATRSTSLTIQMLGAGQADGAWMPQTDAVRAVRMFPNLRILVTAKELVNAAPSTGGIIVVTSDFIAKYPDVIQAFVSAIIEANRDLYKNESTYAEVANTTMPGVYKADELHDLWDGYRAPLGVNGGFDPVALAATFETWQTEVSPEVAKKTGLKLEDLLEKKFTSVALERLGLFQGAPDTAPWWKK